MKKIGIDIVKNKRLKLTSNVLNKILSPAEQALLINKPNKRSKLNFLAGRWAVKEAIYKVLDADQLINFNYINISYDAQKPVITNPELAHIVISIAHEDDYAVGMAVIFND